MPQFTRSYCLLVFAYTDISVSITYHIFLFLSISFTPKLYSYRGEIEPPVFAFGSSIIITVHFVNCVNLLNIGQLFYLCCYVPNVHILQPAPVLLAFCHR